MAHLGRARWSWMAAPLVVAASVTLAAWLGMEAGVFTGLRLRATDAYFPSDGVDPRVVVVGVDRRAIDAAATPWPWPRDLQATMLQRVVDAGARLVVVDVVYSPASPSDERLGQALRSGTVVLAQAGELTRERDRRLLQVEATTGPVAELAAAASGTGHANITPDASDGVVRSLPLAVEDADGALLPSLGLAAVSALDGASLPLTLRPDGVQVGRRFVPARELGMLDVNFSEALLPDSGRRHYLSAASFLPGSSPAPSLKDKIVLVGLVDPTLGDQHLTPVNKDQGSSGVFIHANAINTMLTGTYLYPAGQPQTLGWVFVLALIGGAVVRLRLWLAAAAALTVAMAYVLLAYVRFDGGHVMDLLYPLLALVLAWIAGLGVRYGAEVRQRRRLATVLTQYVPAPVARQLVGRGRDLPEGTVTFLFTDVVGSTRAWEASPQAMSRAMRIHDSLIEESVENAGGAVVRPRGEGDSRFAVFVRPVDAARAATDIARRAEMEPWPTPDPIRLRMAVHVGEGELREGDYYGSPVNRCARIRAVAQPGQILLSESAAAAIAQERPEGAELRDLGVQELKDMAEPEHLFELAPLAESRPRGT